MELRSHAVRLRHPDFLRPLVAHTAAEIAARYGFIAPPSTQKEWVAVISLGGGYSPADLQKYCQRYSIPVPPIVFHPVMGAQNAYTGNPNGADAENCLDIQTIAGASGGKVGIHFYSAPNSGQGFAAAIRQVAIDNLCCACSISWGGAEVGWSQADRQLMVDAVDHCKTAGIPCLASSGDDGSSDGTGGQAVDCPACLPNVIGCGGTSIVGAETAWSYGGGGPSGVYPIPSYQVGLGVGLPSRGVPDISGNADPNSGYPIICGGNPYLLGGTSAVSPLLAAGIALLVSKTGKRVPNFLELLYQLNLLTDITTGSNGAYKAQAGYDYCTGRGVPNAAFWQALVNLANPPVTTTTTPMPVTTTQPPVTTTQPPTQPGIRIIQVTSGPIYVDGKLV